jgi:hypothetical protein
MSLDVFLKAFKEDNWKEFVIICQNDIINYSDEIKSCLDHLIVPDDIKSVMTFQFREYASEWIYKKVPALEGTIDGSYVVMRLLCTFTNGDTRDNEIMLLKVFCMEK